MTSTSHIGRIGHTISFVATAPFLFVFIALKFLWQKIHAFAVFLFKNINSNEPPKISLSDREISFLQKECFFEKTPTPPSPLSDRTISNFFPIPLEDESPLVHFRLPPYRHFDSSLEELRSFFRDFLKLIADKTYTQYAQTPVESIQDSAASFLSYINSISQTLIEMGDKAAKPLFQKFAEQKAQGIDPVFQKIFKKLIKPNIDIPITTDSWRDEQQFEIKKLLIELEEHVTQELKGEFIPPNEDMLRNYIRPTLEWLLGDHSVPLMKTKELENRQENVIDTIFEKAISFLVARKVCYYSDHLQKTIQRSFVEITQHALHLNTSIIADFFSEKIAALIKSISFPELFDEILHEVIGNHIKEIVIAEKHLEEAKTALEHIDENIYPEFYKKYLTNIERRGGKEHFFEHITLKKFSEQQTCKLSIKRMIEQELSLAEKGIDPQHARLVGEQAIYKEISEKLYSALLCTSQKIASDGSVEEVDPFIELWNQLYFPEELRSIVNQFTELTNELVTPSIAGRLQQAKKPFLDVIKEICIGIARDSVKDIFTKVVKTGFERISNRNSWDEIFINTITPIINAQLIQYMMSQEVKYHPDSAHFFLQLVRSEEANRPTIKENIRKKLIELTKSQFNHFDPDKFDIFEEQDTVKFSALSNDDWNSFADGTIQEFEQIILEASPDLTAINESSIKAIFQVYFDKPPSGTDPAFGKIAKELVLELGKGSPRLFSLTGLEKIISDALADKTQKMRQSHDYFTKLMTTSLKENFLSSEWVNTLFLDEQPQHAALTKEKLAHQIHAVSSLAHDLFSRKTKQEGWIVNLGFQAFLTDNPSKLEEMVSNIYNKMFKSKILNMSILVNATNKIFQTMH